MTETVKTKEASVTKMLSRPPTFVPAVSSVLHLPLIPLQATSYSTVSLAREEARRLTERDDVVAAEAGVGGWPR